MRVFEIDTYRADQVRRFLDLPFRLYRDCPQWVPPLEADARRMLDRRAHPFYNHSQAAFFLAEANGQDVGRLAVMENTHFNQYNQTRCAFFGLFECRPDEESALALFEAAFTWARDRGLDEMRGPKGLTALDGLGLLVKGFEHRPALGIPYHLPYYGGLVERAGFAVDGDIVSGYVDRAFRLPEKVLRVAQAVEERVGLRVVRFRSRADLRAFVPRLQELYNQGLEGTSDNTPLTADEARSMADQILWFADPRLIKLIMKGDDLAGFLFAYPDISAALQRTRGRLWPLGWADLLLELRRTRWMNVNGAGVLPSYRGKGVTALLFREIYDSYSVGRFDYADLVQIGVDNERMQNELRSLNIDFYKTHRMYRRRL